MSSGRQPPLAREGVLLTRRRHTRKTLEQRFEQKFERRGPDECWPWTGATNSRGYGVIRLPEDGGLALAHRVALRLDGRDPGGLLARHSCDNPICVNPAHLLPGTPVDNAADMVERGRSLRGEQQPSAKLTEDAVREIRRLHAAGDVTLAELAKRFGVARATVSGVILGYRWVHVAEAA